MRLRLAGAVVVMDLVVPSGQRKISKHHIIVAPIVDTYELGVDRQTW
jgi:hypothetical protein